MSAYHSAAEPDVLRGGKLTQVRVFAKVHEPIVRKTGIAMAAMANQISDVPTTGACTHGFNARIHRRALIASWCAFALCAVATVIWHIGFAKLVAITPQRLPWIVLFYAVGTSSVIGVFACVGFLAGLQLSLLDPRIARRVSKPTKDQLILVVSTKRELVQSKRPTTEALSPLLTALALDRVW
jgi:hypothetical protein